MDLELFKSLSKYPFLYDENFYDSTELAQNKTCSKCVEKDCKTLFSKNTLSDYLCSKQYNNILITVGGHKFILNGLIYTNNDSVPLGRKEVRQKWIVNKSDILLFASKINEIEKHLTNRVNETIEKNFSMFHDFKTSMSIFFNCTQDIISRLPGNTFEEKLKNSDKSYQDLYNSLELITSQLGMVDVIINPKSIEFGRKKTINLYRLFEKIKILFGHLTTKKNDISINLIAEGRIKDCICFESIEFLPLILLDNALKYSVANSNIEIKLEQSYNKVKVIVKNIGPFVSDENKEKIFEKFFRDKSGEEFSKEGIGMGLWIAQQILNAHQSKLCYFKDPNETRTIGLNIFEFDLPTIQSS
jgi:light-regulated signal transduction histidine kinase (bacteriophytochrome)